MKFIENKPKNRKLEKRKGGNSMYEYIYTPEF